MNVEQRVRDALREDAQRLEVPTRLTVDELLDRRGTGRVVPAVAVAATLVAVVTLAVVWGGLAVPQIDPVDRPEPGPPPVEELPSVFDPDAVGFFEQGSIDGGQWRAAAGWQAPHPTAPEGVAPSLCLTLRWEVLPDGVEGEAPGDVLRCGTRLGDQQHQALNVTPLPREPADPRIAIMGVVSDEVAQLVWDLADGELPVAIHEPSGLGRRVFAAVEHATSGDVLVTYAQDGTRLGTWEFTGPDPDDLAEHDVTGPQIGQALQQLRDDHPRIGAGIEHAWHVARADGYVLLLVPVEDPTDGGELAALLLDPDGGSAAGVGPDPAPGEAWSLRHRSNEHQALAIIAGPGLDVVAVDGQGTFVENGGALVTGPAADRTVTVEGPAGEVTFTPPTATN